MSLLWLFISLSDFYLNIRFMSHKKLLTLVSPPLLWMSVSTVHNTFNQLFSLKHTFILKNQPDRWIKDMLLFGLNGKTTKIQVISQQVFTLISINYPHPWNEQRDQHKYQSTILQDWKHLSTNVTEGAGFFSLHLRLHGILLSMCVCPCSILCISLYTPNSLFFLISKYWCCVNFFLNASISVVSVVDGQSRGERQPCHLVLMMFMDCVCLWALFIITLGNFR